MKLATFADAHVGSYGNKIDADTGINDRLIDMASTLNWIYEDAGDRGVSRAIFAGDMFRSHKPTPTELCFARDALAGMEIIAAIPGNHDMPRHAGESSALHPLRGSEFRVCDVPSKVHAEKFGAVSIYCLPYPNRAQLAATLPDYDKLSPAEADGCISAHLQAILQGFRAQLDSTACNILLAHISIDCAEVGAERGIMAGRDITIPLSAIPEEFDFACLGHIHKPQDFAAQGRPNVFYCGSTERIDFGEEGEEKSYVIIDTDARTWERVPIPCRRYYTYQYELYADGDALSNFHPENARDAIVRCKMSRPDNITPDYDKPRKWAEDAGCFEWRGFDENVQRVASVRSEEIVTAQTLEELLGVWHEASSCDVPLDDLLPVAQEIERSVV